MKLLPMERLGVHEHNGICHFGLFLPWVSPDQGNRLWVKIIHERDQFLQDILPEKFELSHSVDPDYGDYWSAEVDIPSHPIPSLMSAWGTEGRYVYRYCLESPHAGEPIDWIIDPFAREFGIGKLSAFTLGYREHDWSGNEVCWKTPPLDDIILYELMINEFGGGIDETIDRLGYLEDLGVNCIELMPVSNVANVVDWGYMPIGYFGVDERFGKRRDLLRLIDAAHQHGIAVIVDAVYGHTSGSFPYAYVYERLGYGENPFMGKFAGDYFGWGTDFGRPFTRDFFFTVNHYWLDRYHVDGFRYDCVPEYWDGPLGQGYAALTYETYQAIKRQGASGHWQRFFDRASINVIQCAEQLESPREILEKTYTCCTCQNETLSAAQGVARGDRGQLTNLGLQLGLYGYPREVVSGEDTIKKTAIQQLETHDQSRFLCNFATISLNGELLREGDRAMWYKVQPYLIGLFTAQGIPMLWQGQEFGENYYVPKEGWGRVLSFRPVRWDYFYDPIGTAVIALVRKLARLRRKQAQFRYGDHFFYNDFARYQSNKVMLFSRQYGSEYSLIALNFGDEVQTVPFMFPFSGDYLEQLHESDNHKGVVAGPEYQITIPSNYGRVWTLSAPG